jgi:hypothetical protein
LPATVLVSVLKYIAMRLIPSATYKLPKASCVTASGVEIAISKSDRWSKARRS